MFHRDITLCFTETSLDASPRHHPHASPRHRTMFRPNIVSVIPTFLRCHVQTRHQRWTDTPPCFNEACLLCYPFSLSTQCRSSHNYETEIVFLSWIATGETVRCQREFWKMSHEAILICRRQIADAVFKSLWESFMIQPSTIPDLQVSNKLRHFQGAFGCLDGCHIPIVPIRESHTRWRNRKGFLSTNVMAVCDCTDSLLFTTVVVGAEGCGSDSTIFKHCVGSIDWLKNGFLLADAGYALSHYMPQPPTTERWRLEMALP